MGPLFLAPVLAGIGTLILTGISGCASSRSAARGSNDLHSDEKDAKPTVVHIPPPKNKKPQASRKLPRPKENPTLPLHWRIMGLEQKLLAFRCQDGNPAVSLKDIRAFRTSPDFRTLADLYDQSIKQNPNHLAPFQGQGFLPAYIYVGAYNLNLGLQEALAASPSFRSLAIIPGAVQVRTNLNWGSYVYFAETGLSGDEIDRLKAHILETFHQQGIKWDGDLRVEVVRIPAPMPVYSYGFHFDLSPHCPSGTGSLI
ncbi:MAG: hypothetical protein R3257_04430 [bacterium]|nr:hypothetical protein [bacterium]